MAKFGTNAEDTLLAEYAKYCSFQLAGIHKGEKFLKYAKDVRRIKRGRVADGTSCFFKLIPECFSDSLYGVRRAPQ